MPRTVPDASATAMLDRENAFFIQRNPASRRLADETARYWFRGVPIQWRMP
jgi:hypothetical protein